MRLSKSKLRVVSTTLAETQNDYNYAEIEIKPFGIPKLEQILTREITRLNRIRAKNRELLSSIRKPGHMLPYGTEYMGKYIFWANDYIYSICGLLVSYKFDRGLNVVEPPKCFVSSSGIALKEDSDQEIWVSAELDLTDTEWRLVEATARASVVYWRKKKREELKREFAYHA